MIISIICAKVSNYNVFVKSFSTFLYKKTTNDKAGGWQSELKIILNDDSYYLP